MRGVKQVEEIFELPPAALAAVERDGQERRKGESLRPALHKRKNDEPRREGKDGRDGMIEHGRERLFPLSAGAEVKEMHRYRQQDARKAVLDADVRNTAQPNYSAQDRRKQRRREGDTTRPDAL